MRREEAVPARELRTETIDCDLVVVGGGLAGTCCAITAARAGLRVTLVQDRPVLGGNASSEVRLWVLGATSHMGNNNRWAREGGVVGELLVENTWRNPEGNPHLFDALLLELATEEPNLRLLLNTAVYEVGKSGPERIASVTGFCSQNSTRYVLTAPLFCDASGDGIVGFLSGAAFRMGAEAQAEFGEKFAPDEAYGELLGHSLYFYSKDVGRPVKYVAPSFALKDIAGAVPRYRAFNSQTYGCRLWWIEYGGRLDTVHETETIKWELWKVVYGVWDYIKNSGQFPDAENLTLEWVGTIPGKRESRRFEGDYLLTQRDLIEQREFEDVVSYGGWSIDLHPADGVYSELPGCTQWHARGIYGIPYRCLYSRNLDNLFLAGRIISASHVAFGSTRVMATCANSAQVVGVAAKHCLNDGLLPRDLVESKRMAKLQRDLFRAGQHLPGRHLDDKRDLAHKAALSASSELALAELPADGPTVKLDTARAMLLPIPGGKVPRVTFTIDASEPTTLTAELRTSDRPDNHTPDVLLAVCERSVEAGEGQAVTFDFDTRVDVPRYVVVALLPNDHASLRCSSQRLTGVLSLSRRRRQESEQDLGLEAFDIWTPARRPGGHNLALRLDPPLTGFSVKKLVNGLARPTHAANAWVAALDDAHPAVHLEWHTQQRLAVVELSFDTDHDHPMESVLWGQPEAAMPFCVQHFRVISGAGEVLAEVVDNHQTRRRLTFDPPCETDRLTIEVVSMHGSVPKAIFEVRCYADV